MSRSILIALVVALAGACAGLFFYASYEVVQATRFRSLAADEARAREASEDARAAAEGALEVQAEARARGAGTQVASDEPLRARIAELEKENLRLKQQVVGLMAAKPKDATAATAPPSDAPKTPAESASAATATASPAATVDASAAITDFQKIAKKGMAGLDELGSSGLVERFRAMGPEGVSLLSEMLRDPSSQARFLAAAIMEGLHDPATVPALSGALQDPDMLVRRMASHGLAVLGDERAIPALEQAVAGDQDFGVRANASYGLAKLGRQSGYDALTTMWNDQSLDASWRLPIFGGIADVGAPAFDPIYRSIISDKAREYSYRYLAINAEGKAGDQGALPQLDAITGDAQEEESLREAAKNAAAKIRGK